MDYIIETFHKFGAWLWGLVKNVFVSLWDIFVDALCYIVDKFLTFAIDMLSTMNVSAFSQVGGSWSTLPNEVLNMLGLLGFGTCMGIIASAIMIRLGLQIIPFVRLGS